MSSLRLLSFFVLLLALAFAGFSLVATRGDSAAITAEFAVAQAHLRAGDGRSAAAAARALLAHEPAHGGAFGVLAAALEAEGSEVDVLERYQTASRRSPRDLGVRGWLASRALEVGDYTTAINHIDAMLSLAGSSHRDLLPMLVQLSHDLDFARALAAHLARQPRWRPAILRVAANSGLPDAADNLHGALREQGRLSRDEVTRWIDGMLKDGRWGSAYARWFSGLEAVPERLHVPWNGDFARMPTSSGFDWRVRRTNGVVFDRITLPGGGHAARLAFLGRPVAAVGIEAPLLLVPGRHLLTLRARTRGMRSDQGLEWNLVCGDGRTRIAQGARIREAHQWSTVELEFDVPISDGCDGQWLRLVNPAPRGVAQVLRGELHVTDVTIARIE
ncbi:BTAD domain-containing putative transcriptional regulator [Luteimonas sp. MC1825]|uniref:BTAD domain-containing putative transcriptional regulator n=1 Tax=Luteimonas sp. MC1825 TaxID=2761107 RepID=UPI00160BE9F4|nr:BTAD domain-containing putative transcriptional regulator [Luteimonas sp. MC1825]MBB6599038.1 hypothetical protein [Luteimonas sp. MC1825]QOC89171.1 hypothetical protein IDM46_05475 [Luteimonas sp. MC1825]